MWRQIVATGRKQKPFAAAHVATDLSKYLNFIPHVFFCLRRKINLTLLATTTAVLSPPWQVGELTLPVFTWSLPKTIPAEAVKGNICRSLLKCLTLTVYSRYVYLLKSAVEKGVEPLHHTWGHS